MPVGTKLGSSILPVKPDGALVVNVPPAGLPIRVDEEELGQ